MQAPDKSPTTKNTQIQKVTSDIYIIHSLQTKAKANIIPQVQVISQCLYTSGYHGNHQQSPSEKMWKYTKCTSELMSLFSMTAQLQWTYHHLVRLTRGQCSWCSVS